MFVAVAEHGQRIAIFQRKKTLLKEVNNALVHAGYGGNIQDIRYI
ncbi:MAG: hypothetical protein WCJ81_03805 [bacterium]